jgi:hypothetical protein
MMSDKDKSATVRVTNKQLKIAISDMGIDLIDTLDSIQNAILSTRTEIRRMNARLDRIEGIQEKSKKDAKNDEKKGDFGHYIG